VAGSTSPPSSLLLSRLDLSDTKVYEPEIRVLSSEGVEGSGSELKGFGREGLLPDHSNVQVRVYIRTKHTLRITLGPVLDINPLRPHVAGADSLISGGKPPISYANTYNL